MELWVLGDGESMWTAMLDCRLWFYKVVLVLSLEEFQWSSLKTKSIVVSVDTWQWNCCSITALTLTTATMNLWHTYDFSLIHHIIIQHSNFLVHRWNKIFVYILTKKIFFNLQGPPKIFQNKFSLSIHIPILDLYWKFFNDSIDVVCNWNFIELSRIRLHICLHPIYLTSLTWRPGGKDCFNFSAFSLSKTTSV